MKPDAGDQCQAAAASAPSSRPLHPSPPFPSCPATSVGRQSRQRLKVGGGVFGAGAGAGVASTRTRVAHVAFRPYQRWCGEAHAPRQGDAQGRLSTGVEEGEGGSMRPRDAAEDEPALSQTAAAPPLPRTERPVLPPYLLSTARGRWGMHAARRGAARGLNVCLAPCGVAPTWERSVCSRVPPLGSIPRRRAHSWGTTHPQGNCRG